jgi:histidine ammonia-lyase
MLASIFYGIIGALIVAAAFKLYSLTVEAIAAHDKAIADEAVSKYKYEQAKKDLADHFRTWGKESELSPEVLKKANEDLNANR